MGLNEQETLALEREKWEKEAIFREREVAVKERELALREDEIALKRKELAAAGWRSPLVVAIMAATLAGLGNAGVTVVNGILQRQLEDRKSEQIRILEMIKTGDPDKAAGNLEFLLNAGLISDPEVTPRIHKFLTSRKPGSGPALPPQTTNGFIGGITGRDDAIAVSALPEQHPLRTAARAVGKLRILVNGSGESVCTAFLVSPDLAMTAGHCVEGATTAQLVLSNGEKEEIITVELPPLEIEAMPEGANYAVMRVKGDPGKKYGMLPLEPRPPAVGELLTTVYFRFGTQQLAVADSPDCRVVSIGPDMFHYLCDTGAGSSGAPILSADGKTVLGVHSGRDTLGGKGSRADVFLAKSRLFKGRI
ncbi:MAG TPA: serine protease [Thermoanaerobaculia bacterium]